MRPLTGPSCLLLAVAVSACSASDLPGDPVPAAAAMAALDARYEVDVSHRTYRGWGPLTRRCTRSFPITVYAPRGAPPSPVFFYLPGTGAAPDAHAEGEAAARAFAARGFLSVVVTYASLAGFSCDAMREKASCVFSEREPASAVAAACALPGAACDRGIVVGGMSQGAAMAVLAKNTEPRVRAAWLMGFGGGVPGDAFTGCYASGATAIADDRIRVIDGASDAQDVRHLAAALGTSCPAGERDCLRPDGSGYYRPLDTEVEDGRADHCFFVGPAAGGKEVGCTNTPPALDAGWLPPARAPWSLLPNLEWLASQCDGRDARRGPP